MEDRSDDAGGRSIPDLTALLIELLRVVKARAFYTPGHRQLAALFARSHRAWAADLERHGALLVGIDASGLRIPGLAEPLGSTRLRDLERALRERGIRALRVDPGIEAEAFAGLAEVLSMSPDALASEGGPAAALRARAPIGVALSPGATAADADDDLEPSFATPASGDATQVVQGAPGPETRVLRRSAPAPETRVLRRSAPAPETRVLRRSAPAPETRVLRRSAPAPETRVLSRGARESATRVIEHGAPDSETYELEPGAPDSETHELEPGAPEPGPPRIERGAGEPETRVVELATAPTAAETASATAPTAAETASATAPTAAETASATAPAAAETASATAPAAAETASATARPRRTVHPGDATVAIRLDDRGLPLETLSPRRADRETHESLEFVEEEVGDGAPAEVRQPIASDTVRDDGGPDRPRAHDATGAPADGTLGGASLFTSELADVLEELEVCEDAPSYVDLARRAIRLAERAGECGRPDEAYLLMVVFAEHAAEEAKRPERQAGLARDMLGTLATGPRMAQLIDRACAPGNEHGVRAAQVLLQLGRDAVVALLYAAEDERDPGRRGRIHGILIALGETALPELLRIVDDEESEPDRLRTAARLLGDIQSPVAVEPLSRLLHHPVRELREEAARALVRIGDDAAIDVLVRALPSRTPGMATHAAYCLAATGSARAVEPLVLALDEAVEHGRGELGRELIRALGRLGRAEATPALAGLLLRGGLFRARRLRELRVAAAAALGSLPGDEAVGALAQGANVRDAQVRRAAQMALDRRARALEQRRTAALPRP